MEKNLESTIMGYIGTTLRIHSFIPSRPTASIPITRSFFLAERSIQPLRRLNTKSFHDIRTHACSNVSVRMNIV